MTTDESQDANETLHDDSSVEGDDDDKGSSNPLSILFAPDMAIWNEARRLITDASVRVENLAVVCVQDPVIMLELLRISNAMYFSAGRSAITSPRTAIVRLGSDVVLETLEKIVERPQIKSEDVKRWFDVHRSRCKRTGIVCRLFAEAIARNLSDDCQAAGCLISVGEMLATVHFQEEYVRLA
ncbi:HDOD domain-containing protein, partial [Oligoflexia bacterium]|nr:HDOD domain-containing protein [Oligoflexia bacterium]